MLTSLSVTMEVKDKDVGTNLPTVVALVSCAPVLAIPPVRSGSVPWR